MANPLYIIIGVLTLTAVSTGLYYSKQTIEEDGFQKRNLFDVGKDNVTLWLYYDQSDINSRWWADFGARSSRVLSMPFLNLCYQSIALKNGTTYNIKIIAGLSDLALLLGGWNELPKALQNPIAPVGEAEMNYIRATVLRRFGGLWVSPSTIFLDSLPDYKKSKNVLFFGTNKDETYSDFKGTSVPGTDIMYSPFVNHPIFEELEKRSLQRIELQEGGKQFRKDIQSDLTTILKNFSNDIEYFPEFEFGRKESGRRIQLEDLLSSNSIPISPEAIYAPVDLKEIQEREMFGWFLRMSEKQILSSNLFIAKLLTY